KGGTELFVEDPMLVVAARDDVVVLAGYLVTRFPWHRVPTVELDRESASPRHAFFPLLSSFCSRAWHRTCRVRPPRARSPRGARAPAGAPRGVPARRGAAGRSGGALKTSRA